jgi:hypothetical protein
MVKIAVATWYNDDISKYADIYANVNRKYCFQHNYDFIKGHKVYIDKEPSYQKVPYLLDILENEEYDYVVWIDADAYFQTDRPIEDFIGDADIHFSQDMTGCTDINCGVFIVKNNKYCRNFLKEWMETKIDNPYPYWWEQGILRVLYEKNILDIQSHSSILEYGTFQTFYDNYPEALIYHLAGRSNEVRLNHIIQKYPAVFKKNLENFKNSEKMEYR